MSCFTRENIVPAPSAFCLKDDIEPVRIEHYKNNLQRLSEIVGDAIFGRNKVWRFEAVYLIEKLDLLSSG